MVVPVDAVANGQHWFRGSIEPVQRGETLIVELAVANDARYATRGVVAATSPETFALRIEPLWERMQQRAFVRISTHGLEVRVVRPTRPAAHEVTAPGDDLYDLVDVSAGGIRFAAEGGFEFDEEVVCHFELPGSLCFVLPARVVRTPETHAELTGKESVAVEFAGLDETHRSQLLRWVYREQVRRHRESARIEQKARRLTDRRSDGER
jgi:c-di-GMP-binding flagellar brake protein YcgR